MCVRLPDPTEEEMATPVSLKAKPSAPRDRQAGVRRRVREPAHLVAHGHLRVDPYYWLRERDNPQVLAYLRAENAYADAIMAHTRPLQERLFQELKERIKQTDQTVPYRLKDYFYYTKFEEGRDYPIYCRRRTTPEAHEEIMLDVNQMAKGQAYFAVAGREVSSEQDLLAFGVDTVGRRIYTIRIKHLPSGELLPDEIRGASGNLVWANDNRTLFYTKLDPVTLRSFQVFRHVVGQDPARDELVYQEEDETYSVWVSKTKSRDFILIASVHTDSTEYRYIPAADPERPPVVIEARKEGHEYEVDHYGGHFYLRTNDNALNFRLVRTPVERPGRDNWEEIVPHRPETFLEEFELFRNHLVLEERRNGLTRLRVIPWSREGEHEIEFDEPVYVAALSDNYEIDTDVVRYVYSSLTTPNSVYDYDMSARRHILLKRDEVLGGFDPANYRSERIYVTAADGARIPVSLVYRTDRRSPGGNPLLLYGYGAYGISVDPGFNPALVSLLDRGFAYAVAHVRGGQELGRPWYEGGKLFNKKNTFTDFIAVAEYLLERGYARRGGLFAKGGSAGGLLVGAVVNLRPDLFAGAIAEVPFVDVVTTMLDESIPLTTSEYDEWGDPRVEEYYRYILSYSPYDNVEPKEYPHLLVTAGIHDSQVQYWEPAKWVAKLRGTKTDNRRLLLKTNMEAGHHGASGRYRRYWELAFQYAFLLDLAGIDR
ncbi:Dipeptidyl aminopeptidase BI [bacterium HR33]|nr:Dipeptidyl aminopeptidase BI [bacterium HR33]